MELNKIEKLLDKYFDGESSITEEKELQNYFSGKNVAEHLVQYKSLFKYFEKEKKVSSAKTFTVTNSKKSIWLSIAAAIVVLLGFCTYLSLNETDSKSDVSLGTYKNPETAFIETQKALAMISTNVNVGIESVQYIEEFETSKNRIFKK